MAGMAPRQALAQLMAGNGRFVKGQSQNPARSPEDRERLRTGQSPMAVVVGCSDSRVPPTVVFDQGLGAIFEVRTAGHAVDDVALGSLEYAVSQLGTRLVLVLGHTDCGAVALAVQGGQPRGHMDEVNDLIDDAFDLKGPGDTIPVAEAVEANVRHTVEVIATSRPVLSDWVRRGEVMVVGTVYDVATGEVRQLL